MIKEKTFTTESIAIESICCIGAGYVGGPTMAIIADNCPNIKINVVDINVERINAWNHSNLKKLPIYEPGLDLIIKRTRNKNLFFSIDINSAIKNADMIFISVNTPTKTKGLGAGEASDLKWVENCARTVSEFAVGHTIVVEKSTMPVRTADVIKKILLTQKTLEDGRKSNKTFSVLSNPEFLAEGTAINDLQKPDRVLIGGENSASIESLAKIYSKWVPNERIIRTNLWSSELSKLSANAFLAQRISSINAIGALCEETGANIKEVAHAIGTDRRIGSAFLNAGPGFGGSCFKKDILNLIYLCNFFGLNQVAKYWKGVLEINDWQQNRISNLIIEKLFNTVANKKITLLGFSFKANTNDTRESPSITIAKNLLEEGAYLAIHDPRVTKQQINSDLNLESTVFDNKNPSGWGFYENIIEAANNSDALIILTEWDTYKKINWHEISKVMRKPAWVFDTRCLINPNSIEENGLNYWVVGG